MDGNGRRGKQRRLSEEGRRRQARGATQMDGNGKRGKRRRLGEEKRAHGMVEEREQRDGGTSARKGEMVVMMRGGKRAVVCRK